MLYGFFLIFLLLPALIQSDLIKSPIYSNFLHTNSYAKFWCMSLCERESSHALILLCTLQNTLQLWLKAIFKIWGIKSEIWIVSENKRLRIISKLLYYPWEEIHFWNNVKRKKNQIKILFLSLEQGTVTNTIVIRNLNHFSNYSFVTYNLII